MLVAPRTRPLPRRTGRGSAVVCGLVCGLPTAALLAQDSFTLPPTRAPLRVECRCSEAAAANDFEIEVDPGTYHYDVELPQGYWDDAGAVFPCLFVACATGDAVLHKEVASFVRTQRWIAVLLVESRNGPVGPGNGNFVAAYDDAMARLRIDPNMVFLSGMSGGGRAASMFAALRSGVAGVICHAAGFSQRSDGKYELRAYEKNPDLLLAVLIGRDDPNHGELSALESQLPDGAVRRHLVDYDGGHQWAPRPITEAAMRWMCVQRLGLLRQQLEGLPESEPAARAALVDAILRCAAQQPERADKALVRGLAARRKKLARARELADETRTARRLAKLTKSLSKEYARLHDADLLTRQQIFARRLRPLERSLAKLVDAPSSPESSRRAAQIRNEVRTLLQSR